MFSGLWRRRAILGDCACGPGRILLRPLHGATCKYEGVVAHVIGANALPDRSVTLYQRLSCRDVTRPPLLQSTAWQIENLTLKTSQ